MQNNDILKDLRAILEKHEESPKLDLSIKNTERAFQKLAVRRANPFGERKPRKATETQMKLLHRLELRLEWHPTKTERLVKSIYPKASRNSLTFKQANRVLRKMAEQLEEPAVLEPTNTRLKVWDNPLVPMVYTFCGPIKLPNTLAEPISTMAHSVSAWRMQAIVLPKFLDADGTIDISELTAPDPVDEIQVPISIDLEDRTIEVTLTAGLHEVGDFDIVVDQFGLGVEVSINSKTDQYVKSVVVNGEIVLEDPHREYFLFLEGQTSLHKVWIGSDEQRDRFYQGLHVGTLLGEYSYSEGGWGPTNHPQPDLELPFRTELHQAGMQEANILLYGMHPTYYFTGNSLGPWRPTNPRAGGGTGGDGIHPYSAIGVSAGELLSSWWKLKGTMARSLTNAYDWGATGPDIPHPAEESQVPSYAAELVRYQKFDQSHASRALVDAMAVFWGTGSMVAMHWLRRQAHVQGEFTPFEEKFHGRGHKHAHRALGWKAFNWALAASTCISPEEREPYARECSKIAQGILDVAMPSGITMRSGSQVDPGPFAAFMNPDIIADGTAPEDTTLVRTFMQAIVAYGAFALFKQLKNHTTSEALGEFIVKGLDNILGHDDHPAPKNHFVVGGVELTSNLVDPEPVELDQKRCYWEMMFWCAAAYGVTEDPEHLTRAANISGWQTLESMLENEYERTGSNKAWWDRTPEIYAETQQLLKG